MAANTGSRGNSGPDKSGKQERWFASAFRPASSSSGSTTRYALLWLAPLLLLLVFVVSSVRQSLNQVADLRDQSEAVAHTYKVLLSTSNLFSLVKDAETGQRGYLLTGEETYLEPYSKSSQEIRAELNRLGLLVSDNEAQKTRIVEARKLLDIKLDELASTIALRKAGKASEALALVGSDQGKRSMDSLRSLVDEMNEEEARFLKQRSDAVEPAAQELRTYLILRASILAAAIAIAWLLVVALARRRRELLRSRNLIATTLASIGDAVIVTDVKGRITFLNTEAERLTGWSSAEAAGRMLPEVFKIINETSREPVENPVDKVIRLGSVVGLANHTLLISRQGVETPIDDSAAPIREIVGDPSSPFFGVVLCFRDFTEHKLMENQLHDHRRTLETKVAERTLELEKAHERVRITDRMASVGTLASGLAHDISNILLPLSARLKMVNEHAMNDELRSHVGVISTLLDHLRAMGHNLSLFARDPEQEGSEGKTDIPAWSANVRNFIDASTLGDPVSRTRDIRIEWNIPESLPPVAIAPHRLTQIVLNLVHNARDAILVLRSQNPAAASESLISIQAMTLGKNVQLKVSDTGCGMDEETRQRCTELFFTTKTVSPKGRTGNNPAGLVGTGLGMALIHTIVLRAGGSVDIHSAPERGTAITLTLPIVNE